MKLLMCMECADIFNLKYSEKTCGCGAVNGKYITDQNIEYSGNAQLLGISSRSFNIAIKEQKMFDDNNYRGNSTFAAFTISNTSPSVKKIP